MPEYVYALHDFLPEHEDEVTFHAGERIEVIEKDDLYNDGWWQVSMQLFSFNGTRFAHVGQGCSLMGGQTTLNIVICSFLPLSLPNYGLLIHILYFQGPQFDWENRAFPAKLHDACTTIGRGAGARCVNVICYLRQHCDRNRYKDSPPAPQ